jgi:hypothetical protein
MNIEETLPWVAQSLTDSRTAQAVFKVAGTAGMASDERPKLQS